MVTTLPTERTHRKMTVSFEFYNEIFASHYALALGVVYDALQCNCTEADYLMESEQEALADLFERLSDYLGLTKMQTTKDNVAAFRDIMTASGTNNEALQTIELRAREIADACRILLDKPLGGVEGST